MSAMTMYYVLHLLEKILGSGVNSEWFPIDKVSAYWGSNMPFGVPVGLFQGSVGTILGFTSSIPGMEVLSSQTS